MTNSEIREVLLVEAHRIVNEEARRVVQKIGKPIPEEARPGYLTDEDISILKQMDSRNMIIGSFRSGCAPELSPPTFSRILPRRSCHLKSWMHWEGLSCPPLNLA